MLSNLVSFADGSSAWRLTGGRLRRQAINSGYFSRVEVLNARDVSEVELDRSARGFGHWRWKPEIILSRLRALEPWVDGVWYIDAGCSIFNSIPAQLTMQRFSDIAMSNKIGLFFQLEYPYTDANFTKHSVAQCLGARASDLESGQFQATAFFVRRTPEGIKLVEDWTQLSRQGWPFDDSFDVSATDSMLYGGHRHDQSVLSLLLKMRGYVGLQDELNVDRTDLLRDMSLGTNARPIVATRHRSFFSDLRMNPLSRGIRAAQALI